MHPPSIRTNPSAIADLERHLHMFAVAVAWRAPANGFINVVPRKPTSLLSVHGLPRTLELASDRCMA